jgi:hypothetical protein
VTVKVSCAAFWFNYKNTQTPEEIKEKRFTYYVKFFDYAFMSSNVRDQLQIIPSNGSFPLVSFCLVQIVVTEQRGDWLGRKEILSYIIFIIFILYIIYTKTFEF